MPYIDSEWSRRIENIKQLYNWGLNENSQQTKHTHSHIFSLVGFSDFYQLQAKWQYFR